MKRLLGVLVVGLFYVILISCGSNNATTPVSDTATGVLPNPASGLK